MDPFCLLTLFCIFQRSDASLARAVGKCFYLASKTILLVNMHNMHKVRGEKLHLFCLLTLSFAFCLFCVLRQRLLGPSDMGFIWQTQSFRLDFVIICVLVRHYFLVSPSGSPFPTALFCILGM